MNKNFFYLSCSSKRMTGSLDLVGFFEEEREKLNKTLKTSLVKLKKKGLTLISEENKLFFALGKKKNYNLACLSSSLSLLVTIKNYKVTCHLTSFTLDQKVQEREILQAFAEKYYFYNHQTVNYQKKKPPVTKVYFHLLTTLPNASLLLKKSKAVADAINLCRDWQNQAPNLLHSEAFADQVSKHYQAFPKIECQILDKKAIIAEKMNLFLAVNAGSQYQPRLVVLKYFPLPTEINKPFVLLGKGITFDTGGYSLKPSNYQLGMKFDMSGAAVVLATMQALAQLALPINVVAIACLTDNAIGKKATLVESVITSKSGKTVEITNTDAEGRLILADGMSYAFHHFSPQQMIELSTLTGAIAVTLGTWMTGAFSNNDKLYQEFYQASKVASEPIWRLPVSFENFNNMKSPLADLVNASKSYKGGASNAAAFLFNFIEKKCPFLHLDIAGTATWPENVAGTGVMVKTLVHFFSKKTKNKV